MQDSPRERAPRLARRRPAGLAGTDRILRSDERSGGAPGGRAGGARATSSTTAARTCSGSRSSAFPSRPSSSRSRRRSRRSSRRYGEVAGESARVVRPRPSTTAGRVLALRTAGKAGFLDLSDGRARVQVYLRRDAVGDAAFELYRALDLGDWLGVEGEIFRTRTGELSVKARSLTFLAKCFRPLPEKWHGLKDVERAVPPALPRPRREPGVARGLRAARRDRAATCGASSTSAATSRSRRR